jgi:transketolase
MAAACNGMALCGLRPYAATFFVFFDYLKPALRLSALGELGVIYVLTHDSIGLGEDGPTHQPIEHLASARAVPGLNVFRPADANEVAEAYRSALLNPKQPAVMVLSRQNLPTLDRTNLGPANGVAKGGYILKEATGGEAECILIGTGSEIPLCLDAADILDSEGIRTRVVSLPCWELFAEQDHEYREHVLPASIPARVACEAASGFGWERWLGQKGTFIGMNGFGASGPAKKLFEHFGITTQAVVAAARDLARK